MLISLYKDSAGISALQKPEKIYLENTNLIYALGGNHVNKGNLRKTFFANQLSYENSINYSSSADFTVNDNYTFEIGGKGKQKKQIEGIDNAYIVSDDIEFGSGNRIPLWIFGLMY